MTSIAQRTLILAGLLGLALSSSASAAVTIGSNLTHAPNTGICGPATPGGSCTEALVSVAGGYEAPGGLQAPSDGVVVRWRVRSAAAFGGTLRPRVVSKASVGGQAGDAIKPPNVAAVLTYATRLSIHQGDFFGVDVIGGNGALILYSAPLAGVTAAWYPALLPGEKRFTLNPGKDRELLASADIEPDADSDGYGDETQDQCPTDASAQGPCPILATNPVPIGTIATPATTPVAAPAATPVTVVLDKLVGSAAFARKLHIKQVLQSGLIAAVGSSQPATVVARATLASRTIALGTATVTTAGDAKITLRVKRAARKRLRRARKAKLTVVLTLTDLTGRTTTLSRRVTLVR